MKRLAILFVVGCVASGGVAHAATYYVSKAGSDGNAGTQASPFLTLNRGASVLVSGDTLLVRGGTYAEGLVSVPSGSSWTNKVRIAAYPGETVWLAPSSGYYVIHLYSWERYVEFDGINLDSRGVQGAMRVEATASANPHHIRFQNAEIIGGPNGNVEGLYGPQAIQATASAAGLIGNNEFINLTIHGGGDPGDMYYGFYVNSSDNLIAGCNIYDVAGAAIQIYSSYGASTNNNIIRNNIIHDIRRSMDDRTYGLILASGAGNKVYNNVIYNIDSAQSYGIRVYSALHEIYNNTVYNVTQYGIQVLDSASGAIIRNNIAYRNGTNYLNSGAGTVASNNSFDGTDPRFVDVASGDFHLQPTSVLRDAGVTIGLFSVDREGVPRPQGSAFDLGALEYQDSTSTGGLPPPTGLRIVKN